ncbi:MAG: type III-B CRISPR module-associated protein Cmr3 [Planctomycetes bacterium]|nr:type III-B CRISPR module-associated protein Cmr3 [Planctomycetota bacterium]
MTTTVGLTLEPLDVLFFRDGRPFGAGTHGKSQLPLPQTLAGALWTALLEKFGCDFGELARLVRAERASLPDAIARAGGASWLASVRVRGPWLARPENKEHKLEVLMPVPAVLHVDKKRERATSGTLPQLRPMRPDRLPGWQPPKSTPALWPLWVRHPQPTEPATGYLTRAGLDAFLRGDAVPSDEVIKPDALFGFDRRTGIGINADRLSAEESLIYGANFLVLKPNVTLYAEAILPDGIDSKTFAGINTVAFGGEGRRVRLTVLNQPYSWPDHTPTEHRQKPLVLLTTPALFDRRWQPASLAGRLVAAAVPGAVAVSGWDLARGGPKPNRFAVMAGSTYFLDLPLNPWPETLSDSDPDQQQGWGCFIKGVWTEG